MKRAATMNNIKWSLEKGFVHGKVQFQIKKLFYFMV
jgi:hypothetical protein